MSTVDSFQEEMPSFPIFQSWKEIIDFYQKFLSGKIESCPTHGGPLEEESQVIKAQLLAINRLSVLTIDSQPGLLKANGSGNIYWRGRERLVDRIECRQRAALLCFMYKPQLEKLKKAFVKKDYLIFAQRAKVGVDSGAPRFTTPITTTSFVYRGKERTITESRQSTDGWISCDMEMILEGSSEKKMILKNLYQVNLLDPVWGRTTQLFDDLIVALQ